MLPSFGPPCMLGRYRLLGKVLGKGNYARVEEALHVDLEPSEAHVAIKMIDTHTVRDPYVLRHLEREAEVLRMLRHPNIIAIFEVLKAGRYHCIVTELVGGGELCTYVRAQQRGHLDEATTLQFGAQLISALAHMHGLNVVHRDLKMKNIVLTRRQDQVKIVDFGLGRTWNANKPLVTSCGSPGYAAPEIYLKSRPYGPKVDLWSLGVVLYYMAVGDMPFPPSQDKTRSLEDRRNHLVGLITKGATEGHVKHMAHFSPGFRDLVQGLLTANPSRRLSLQQAVEHPWVGNRLRARHLLNIHYKLSGQERALILTKLAVMLNTTVQSIEAQCRQKDLGEVAAMYHIMAHKQLSTYHASWMLRPTSPRRVTAEVTAAVTMGQGGPRHVPGGASRTQQGPQRHAAVLETAADEEPADVRVEQPESSVEGDGGDEYDKAVSVKSEQDSPTAVQPRPLPAPRQRLALQGAPRPEPRKVEVATAEAKGALQGAPRPEPREAEAATAEAKGALQGAPRPEPRGRDPAGHDVVDSLQETISVTSTAATSTIATSAGQLPASSSVGTVSVDTADAGTLTQATTTAAGGQGTTEYELACLLRDGNGRAQLRPMPETRVMFYTETVLDNLNGVLYSSDEASTSKSDGKVLVSTGTGTANAGHPIKSALASQTGLAAKTRKAVSFSVITTTHSADSGAEGNVASQDAACREASVQADLKATSAPAPASSTDQDVNDANSKPEPTETTDLHYTKVDQGANPNEKISHNFDDVCQEEIKCVVKEGKFSPLNFNTQQDFMKERSSSLQLKVCLTPEDLAATEKLFKTVPVSRKVSPEPKRNLYEARRSPLKSPREVYKRMKGHPRLSASHLLDDQENYTFLKTSDRPPHLSSADNFTSLPTHKEVSDKDENGMTKSITTREIENVPKPLISEEHTKSQCQKIIKSIPYIESQIAEEICSGKDDTLNEGDEECSKVHEPPKNEDIKKRTMGTVAELVRSKLSSLQLKDKHMELKPKVKVQPKFNTKGKRNKAGRYQRFFTNNYRVDLALVMTLERSRRSFLQSLQGPWRSQNTDNLGKNPERHT